MRHPKKTANPKIAVAYLRVSTDDQKLGPQAQRAQIEAWATKESIEVASWHLDEGVSGGAELEEVVTRERRGLPKKASRRNDFKAK